MIRLRTIRPSRDPFDLAAYRRARTKALDETAKETKQLLEQTTATWRDKPAFEIQENGENERVVGTDDEIYGYVDDGTRPHVIVAKSGGVLAFGPGAQAKTRPRVISSGSGSRGGATVFRPRVQHPGTEAREFSETIAEQADELLARNMQRAIDGVA